MRPIRFEEADSVERTQIGEGLTQPAAATGRLKTGRAKGEYFLRHDDGCTIRGKPAEAGSPLYLNPDVGEVLCEKYEQACRES